MLAKKDENTHERDLEIPNVSGELIIAIMEKLDEANLPRFGMQSSRTSRLNLSSMIKTNQAQYYNPNNVSFYSKQQSLIDSNNSPKSMLS